MKKTVVAAIIAALALVTNCVTGFAADATSTSSISVSQAPVPTPPKALPIGSLATLTSYAHEQVRGVSGGVYGNTLSYSGEVSWFYDHDDSGKTSEYSFLAGFNSTKFQCRVIDPAKQSTCYVQLHNADGNQMFWSLGQVSYYKRLFGSGYNLVAQGMGLQIADHIPVKAGSEHVVPTNAYLVDENGNWVSSVSTDDDGGIWFPTNLADEGLTLVVGYDNLVTGQWGEYAYTNGELVPEYVASGYVSTWLENYSEDNDSYYASGDSLYIAVYGWRGDGLEFGVPTTRLDLKSARWVEVWCGIYGPKNFVEYPSTVWVRQFGSDMEEAIDMVNARGWIYLQPGTYIVYPETNAFDRDSESDPVIGGGKG